MSIGIMSRTGRYLHAPDAKFEKSFPSGRKFTVLIAGAYHAGIIGPEHNGIVILDENHSSVVLDRHMQIDSGYHGPSAAQVKEAKRILDMTWNEFSEFCRTHERFRGTQAMPDAYDLAPMRFEEPENRFLYTEDAKNGNGEPVEHRTRLAIVEYLMNHQVAQESRHSNYRLAWSIDVDDIEPRDAEGSAEYDERWENYAASQEAELLVEARDDVLEANGLTNGEYSTYPGNDHGQYSFIKNGDTLLLESVEGVGEADELIWERRHELSCWLLELDDDALRKLYRVVTAVEATAKAIPDLVRDGLKAKRQFIEEHYWEKGLDAPGEEAMALGF